MLWLVLLMTDAERQQQDAAAGAGAGGGAGAGAAGGGETRVGDDAITPLGPETPEDPAVFSARVAAGVATTALMAAIDVFLFGAVIAPEDATPRTYSAVLLLIVVSGLGFLYGTLIYANSHERLRSKDRFARQMACANVISEVFGVFPLVLAIPLAVVAVTSGPGLA